MNDESLVAEMKALLAARRREDPLVIAMSADVKTIRTEMRGLNQHCNLALGNSREAVESLQQHQTSIDCLQLTVSELRAEIHELRTLREADKKELDSFIQWAKTKGKQ